MSNDRVTTKDVYELMESHRKEAKADNQRVLDKVDKIESKVDNILGWAGGVGGVVAIIIVFVKDLFTIGK